MESTASVITHQPEETFSSYTRPDDLVHERPFSHRWTIDNFSAMLADDSSSHPKFSSAPFCLPANSAIQFCIELRPTGECAESKEYLGIYLSLKKKTENNTLLVNRSFCLINSKGEKYKEIIDNKPSMYSSMYPSWGWKKYIARSDLLNPANNLLNEDRLTILCEVNQLKIVLTEDPAKYMPSLEEVKVLSKMQTLVDLLERDKQTTDVTLVVGNGAKAIRAHKFVLAGSGLCTVFENMFKYDITRKKEKEKMQQSTVVTLSDVSIEVCQLFIRFLHTGRVNQLDQYAEELLAVADMYGTDLLKRMCEHSLSSQITTESVCQLFLLSDRHSSTELQRVCIEYITSHASEVIQTDQWEMMSLLDDQLKVDLFCKLVSKSRNDDSMVQMEAYESVNAHQLNKTDTSLTTNSAKYIPSLEKVKVLSTKKTLANLTSLFECDNQTDVTVVVGNGAKEIRTHKFVLMGGSSVFGAMFAYDTREKQSGIVTLTDVSLDGGELFIRYLYTGTVNQLETCAEELFVVADMYGIDLLKRMCANALCKQVTTESVWQLLLLADRHSSTELQRACIEYIISHASEVIRNEDWQMMSQVNDQLKVDLFRKLVNKTRIDDSESDHAHQLNDTASNTSPSKYTFSHQWTIDDFSVMLTDTSSEYEYPDYRSALFSSPINSEAKFSIILYPKGDSEDSQDYLSLYLELKSYEQNALYVDYSFYLVNSNGEKYEESFINDKAIFSSSDISWGWDKYFVRSEILDPANDLLNEDKLTINCEVTLFDTLTMNSAKYIPRFEEVVVRSKKKTLADLTSLLECDKQTDVTVVLVGNGAKKVRAHKFVLIAGSLVFKEMFKNDTTEMQSGVVTMTVGSLEVGELFIRYLYSGTVNQLEAYAKELFVVADKYGTDLLKRMCVHALRSQINTDSVFKLLLFGQLHSSNELQHACIEYITSHATELVRTDHWQMISQLNEQVKVDLYRYLADKH